MRITSTPIDPYERIAALYDLEHADYDEDLACYANFIEATGDPVLELGCGTGRLLLPIAAAGYRVTGVDRSSSMLDRARKRLDERGLERLVTLHQGSMTDATNAPGGPFGIVIVALNGFLHLSTAQEQRAALDAMRRSLDPRGQLVLDVLNPTPAVLHAFDHAVVHEGTWTAENGTRVDKFAARRVMPATQTIHTELWYDLTSADGTLKRTAVSYDMRYVHRAELELMLEISGFVEWQLYGSYDLDPYDDTAERLLVAAEVTSSG